MKKILFLLAFLCVQTFSQAQFNVGANGILQFLQGDFKQETSLAYGGSVSVGYTFDQRVDLSLVYTTYMYNSRQEFGLNSKTAEAKFFFFKESTRPYIGCGVGIYSKSITSDDLPKYIENVWGFEPKAGVLLDSKILKNLFVDASVSYMYANTKFNSPKAFNLSAGLKYMIDFQKGSI
ncbi:MAG: OmpW family outer membrane protein [Bacteroidota bacterium]|nr:OmpW family outer membrane protein [Bacteroidota bacterium]